MFRSKRSIWLGREYALVKESGDVGDIADFRQAQHLLKTAARDDGWGTIQQTLYRALALAETKTPAGIAGAFIAVGNTFDAFAALSRLLQEATTDVMIVDPYMDETILTDYGGTVPENVPLRLLTDAATYKPILEPAAKKWVGRWSMSRSTC
jgi:hypothetical protein